MQVKVTVKSNTAITDPVVSITNALIAYANGLIEGDPGLIIGAAVSPSELAGAIFSQVPGLFITKVEIKKSGDPSYVVDLIPMEVWERAVINAGSVTVVQI